jgi:DNA polymerase-1
VQPVPETGGHVTRSVVAFDLETHLVKPGMVAPRMVCLSHAVNDPKSARVVGRDSGLPILASLLADPDTLLVGHNVSYDIGVACAEDRDLIPVAFQAYREDRVRDTKIRQMLIDIHDGALKFRRVRGGVVKTTHKLADLAAHWLDVHLKKGADTWQLRYHELDGVPVNEWPPDAYEYSRLDSEITLAVWLAQDADLEGDAPLDEGHQCRTAWALHLMSCWGVRTDPALTQLIRETLEAEREDALKRLDGTGLIRSDGTRDVKLIRERVLSAWKSLGKQPPRTLKTGAVQMTDEVLRESGDPDLILLAMVSHNLKLLNTYVPILESGTVHPICARYNNPLETGRTSASEPNMQNPPRAGGIRECFVPREGFLFASCDYDTLELRALAQVCLVLLGKSSMAEALRAGRDLHLAFAADLMGIGYEQAVKLKRAGDKTVKEMRQLAKIANFGFPGGMVSNTFVEYARGYGVTVDGRLAERLYRQWRIAWPEMDEYFKHAKTLTGPAGEGKLTQLFSGRVRGGVSYTAACNSYFQGLAADGATAALFVVSQECYTDPASPLYGSRPVIFLHDEIICEVPDVPGHPEVASRAADRLAEIMIAEMRRYIPDVPVTATPNLMRRWYKGAEEIRNAEGWLVPWEPQAEDEEAAPVAAVG